MHDLDFGQIRKMIQQHIQNKTEMRAARLIQQTYRPAAGAAAHGITRLALVSDVTVLSQWTSFYACAIVRETQARVAIIC